MFSLVCDLLRSVKCKDNICIIFHFHLTSSACHRMLSKYVESADNFGADEWTEFSTHHAN